MRLRGLRRRAGCGFLPSYLLEHVAASGDEGMVADGSARAAAGTLALDAGLRASRSGPLTDPGAPGAVGAGVAWTVHTAGNGTTLPGRQLRAAGDPPTGDLAADEAAVGGSGALALFAEVYGRNSYDGQGATVVMTVHYGRDYDNAFWNGRQLVFGDGDGQLFDRFTKPVDVLGHEFTHAVTEHTAGFVYRDQPGALNESMSDVFAACAKQRMLDQSVTDADWLIGAGLFLPGVQGRALRDMAAPGTAYDDPRLGRDRQVGHFDDYVHTSDDNGGVHINSGIPNRAFYLAATAIGGRSWDGAGAIWYAALTSSDVGPTSGFAAFAAATVAAAGAHRDAVVDAWGQVGVEVVGGGAGAGLAAGGGGMEAGSGGAGGSGSGGSGSVGLGSVVAVHRSGGYAGVVRTGEVDLDGDDPRAGELRELVGRVGSAAADAAGPAGAPGGAGSAGAEGQADRFVYRFTLPGVGELQVPEQHLSADLQRLADVVLSLDS